MSDNKLKVEIYGKQYTLMGNESSNHMREVANHVDETMRKIGQQNTKLDASQLAVLSAVNIADEYLKLKREHSELLNLIEDDTPLLSGNSK